MHDPLRGVREHHRLNDGATLADELRRLYPQGFGARWMLHKAQALADGEIDPSLHEQLIVDESATYIVTVKPSGPALPFIGKLLLSIAISYLIGRLTAPGAPRQANVPTEEETRQSPNNQLAAQSNRLRAGARVPDILGRVRSYPDLLTAPVEKWFWPRTQSIVGYFVVGRGTYQMSAQRLGDTPISSIEGVSFHEYFPGDIVPNIQAIRAAPTVDGISLSAQESGTTVTGVTFDAETRTVTANERIPLVLHGAYFITGTFLNTLDCFINSVPLDSQTVGPYVYGLDAVITDEAGVNAVFNPLSMSYNINGSMFFNPRGITNEIDIVQYIEFATFQVGDLIAIVSVYNEDTWGHFEYYGRIVSITRIGNEFLCIVENMDGTSPVFIERAYESADVVAYIPGGASRGRLPGDAPGPMPLLDTPQYTSWFTAPIETPDEIWLDFEFPGGLAHYVSGARHPFSVSINVDFRATAAPSTVVSRVYTYTASANVTQRATEVVKVVDDLGMVGPIEVRMIRTTPLAADTSTDQYLQETVWKWLRAVKNLPPRAYPDVTVLSLVTFNSVSAASVGETSFNVIATRVLPTWTGSAWSAPAPTEKWADNIVARMKAADGASKTDAEIDLAGIYALQASLDAMDAGDQGKISMTLDELQDIDAELQLIASIVRAQVYRIGRKLFVTRDQGGKVPLALFTGRSKSPEGETVQLAMKNDGENDAVITTWFDRANGWKQREYQYPVGVTPVNALHVTPVQATWAQAYRRAVYEWNRSQYRRDVLTMQATEEARLIHIGDVVNVTDDIANLAQSAGEVFAVAGLTLTLDRDTNLAAGGFSIMLRGQDGRALDSMPVTQGASLRQIILSRAAAFAIKGRDDGMGTIYAIYQTASAVIRPWLVTNLEPGPDYTSVAAVNWRTEVFAGDAGTLPPVPTFDIVRGLPNDDAA
jgi:hypothetical protein